MLDECNKFGETTFYMQCIGAQREAIDSRLDKGATHKFVPRAQEFEWKEVIDPREAKA